MRKIGRMFNRINAARVEMDEWIWDWDIAPILHPDSFTMKKKIVSEMRRGLLTFYGLGLLFGPGFIFFALIWWLI